ncbi:MAG: Sapep family Mn(2+)-dependent dipeptidase [Candidatus Sumerlaeia bacterium]|nr:Sapep family Mn(2+)-dependent dipeptidase [Candidatus Sumerlaeia bacterium]
MAQTLDVQDVRDRIARELDTVRAQYLADTAQLLRFKTVSGGNAEEEADYQRNIPLCLDWLAELSVRMGFAWRRFENRAAEIAWESPAPGRKTVGIAAHIDVVTAQGSWKHAPFSATTDGGVLYARGTQDDKGPLMASLYGMYAAKRAGIEPAVDVRLIIGTCEETGDWDDIAFYLAQRGAPDMGFTPDATFPITNGEKGMLNLLFEASWDDAGEDAETGLRFEAIEGGARTNIVPERCEARFSYPGGSRSAVTRELMRSTTEFTVQNKGANITLLPEDGPEGAAGSITATFLGKAAHSSLPHLGHNAILDALSFFSDVSTLPAGVRAFVQFLLLVGKEADGANLMIAEEHPFIGRTTVNLGIVKIGPTGGKGYLNIRPTLGVTVDRATENAKEAAAAFGDATGLQVSVKRHGKALDAIHLDPEEPSVAPFIAALQQSYTAVTGREASLCAIGGTTYAKAFPSFCAFGPVDTNDEQELAHQADERVSVDALMRNATIYGTSIALMR